MSDDDDDKGGTGLQSFGQRHGLTIITIVMIAMFALVIVIQMVK